jgi:hypothetical protein
VSNDAIKDDTMTAMVSSILPFPNIWWWANAVQHTAVSFDRAEHFQKMSYRNRYYIPGANGLIVLSIPLAQGREQRRAMKDVAISNSTPWHVQHWRTITSVYKRSPYFDYYEQSLQDLFERPFTLLADFNTASIHWLKAQLKISFEENQLEHFIKDYPGQTDLRQVMKPGTEKTAATSGYYQVFADRTGFLPNMSMLDLLFAEGPHATDWLRDNKETIMNWK